MQMFPESRHDSSLKNIGWQKYRNAKDMFHGSHATFTCHGMIRCAVKIKYGCEKIRLLYQSFKDGFVEGDHR